MASAVLCRVSSVSHRGGSSGWHSFLGGSGVSSVAGLRISSPKTQETVVGARTEVSVVGTGGEADRTGREARGGVLSSTLAGGEGD